MFAGTYKRISDKFEKNMRFLRDQVAEYTAKFDAHRVDNINGPLPFAAAYLKAKKKAEEEGQVGSALYR